MCVIMLAVQRYSRGTPAREKAGKPLAGGWKGCLFFLIGDLDYFGKVLKLNMHNKSSDFCCLCKATITGAHSFTDNRVHTAPWLNTCFTAQGWRDMPGKV